MPFPNKATQFKRGESRVTDIEIKRLGGRTKSVKRKIAQQLRWLREKGLNEKNSQHLVELLKDKELTALDVLAYVKKLIAMSSDNPNKLNLGISRYLEWVKTFHGQKFDISSVNVDLKCQLKDLKDFLEIQEKTENE